MRDHRRRSSFLSCFVVVRSAASGPNHDVDSGPRWMLRYQRSSDQQQEQQEQPGEAPHPHGHQTPQQESNKLEMKNLKLLGGRRKPRRVDQTPLINSSVQDGCIQEPDSRGIAMVQHSFSPPTEQRVPVQELVQLLMADRDEADPGPRQQQILQLLSQFFPEAPADLEGGIQGHLNNVQETMLSDLRRLRPELEGQGLMMGRLVDCYHQHMFQHLSELLQKVHCSPSSFALMKWVLQNYLSKELLHHPDLQGVDPVKSTDLLLLTDWMERAKVNLIQCVQKDVRKSLDYILQNERSEEHRDGDEANVQFYVDTIQCINSQVKTAQTISSKLSDDVEKVCAEELLMFVTSYAAEQTETLQKKAKAEKTETIHFFKTLNNCKEIKKHVQGEGRTGSRRLHEQTVTKLENLEDFTLTLLRDVVSRMAENHFKDYFKSDGKKFFSLLNEINTHFPKLSFGQDVHQKVLDDAYSAIVQTYVKHLLQRSQKKLRKSWSGADVAPRIRTDAERLHRTVSDLAAGVQEQSLVLQKIFDLLQDQNLDQMKLTAATLQEECPSWREEQDFLSRLLRWRGLSRGDVRAVLDALPDPQPRPRSLVLLPPCCC
ncbi:uncharacterized protein V6R79_005543 [Siganus canaliculatus]